MSIKQNIVFSLRKTGLLERADYAKFLFSFIRYFPDNIRFLTENKGVALPPDFILYESFGRLSYRSYYFNGKESAQYIAALLEKHKHLEKLKILEWGCGPARLLRHLPELLANGENEFWGSDYNKKTIEWCQDNVSGISFDSNMLEPPLKYGSNSFDILYCISVFTHLSIQKQKMWLDECLRVLKTEGIFLLTVHGDSCIDGLLPHELACYKTEGYVVRECVTEGKRTYVSYNNPIFMRNELLYGLDILDHITGDTGTQDIWIIRK